MVCTPCLLVPEQVIIQEPPELRGGGNFRPSVEILNATNFKQVWESESAGQSYWVQPKRAVTTREVGQQTSTRYVVPIKSATKTLELSSDLYFRIRHKQKLICRFALNPAFVKGE